MEGKFHLNRERNSKEYFDKLSRLSEELRRLENGSSIEELGGLTKRLHEYCKYATLKQTERGIFIFCNSEKNNKSNLCVANRLSEPVYILEYMILKCHNRSPDYDN